MMNTGKLVVFCCENSALLCVEALKRGAAGSAGNQAAAADAGALRGDPAAAGVKVLFDAITVVPLPCSGKIEMGIILKTLEEGASGVLVLGCPEDNCKFFRGSARARKRTETVSKLLEEAGVNPKRVRMGFLSSVDPEKFRTLVAETLEDVRSVT